MFPVLLKAPPTYPDIVEGTPLRVEYLILYADCAGLAWVFAGETADPRQAPISCRQK
jgi:hypothetical protein